MVALLDDVFTVLELPDDEVLRDLLPLLAGQHLNHWHALDEQEVAEAVPAVELFGRQHGHAHGRLAVTRHTHRRTALVLQRKGQGEERVRERE